GGGPSAAASAPTRRAKCAATSTSALGSALSRSMPATPRIEHACTVAFQFCCSVHCMAILPAHAYLDRHGIPYERRAFPPDTEKGAASVARALGFRERQMVKTLIFETDRGERVL